MNTAEAARVAAIRAHVEAHRNTNRAAFWVSGIALLLRLLDEAQARVHYAEGTAAANIDRAEKAEARIAELDAIRMQGWRSAEHAAEQRDRALELLGKLKRCLS